MQLSVFSLAMWLFMAVPISSQVENHSISASCSLTSNPLEVTITGPGTAAVSWTLVNPALYEEYTVSVFDLTLGQLSGSVLTTNFPVSFGNLISGHDYRFTVRGIYSSIGGSHDIIDY